MDRYSKNSSHSMKQVNISGETEFDSGFESMPSGASNSHVVNSDGLDSTGQSYSLSLPSIEEERKQTAAAPSPKTNKAELQPSLTLEELYEKLDSVNHPRELLNILTANEIEDASRLLFTEVDSEKNFPALIEAFDGQDKVVTLAVAVARCHDQLNQRNGNGQTLLLIATAACEAYTVRDIYTKGGDLKHKDAWCNNPIHIAAELGRADCIEAFCTKAEKHEQQHQRFGVRYIPTNRKEDITLINNDGKAPIHLAVENGHREVLETLLSLSKPARDFIDIRRYTDGYSPAHIAVELGSYEMLEVCLRYGSDSEVRNYKCETPQQMAFLLGRNDLVKLCQNYGASPDQLSYAVTEYMSESDEEMSDFEEMRNGVDGMQIS